MEDLKSTHFKSLSQTSFFFCQESGVSFLAASSYSVPVDKGVNPCCFPFRFVYKILWGLQGKTFHALCLWSFPNWQFRHQFQLSLIFSIFDPFSLPLGRAQQFIKKSYQIFSIHFVLSSKFQSWFLPIQTKPYNMLNSHCSNQTFELKSSKAPLKSIWAKTHTSAGQKNIKYRWKHCQN